MSNREYLSKREQQIMDLIYRHGRMSANAIQAALPGEPANSSVRTLLSILERKGWLRHEEEGTRYVYFPARAHDEAAKSALQGVIQTFFNGSWGGLVATLVSDREVTLTDEEIAGIKELISKAEAEK